MLALLMSLLVLSGPSPTPAEQAAINSVLDGLHQAASKADADAYFGSFTADARFIGTDASEHWSLQAFRDYATPYFSRGQGWTYHPSDRVITVADIPCRCVAWFDEQLDNENYGRTRGSGVLRLTDEGWKVEQYVLSFAVPNDRAHQVVQTIKGD